MLSSRGRKQTLIILGSNACNESQQEKKFLKWNAFMSHPSSTVVGCNSKYESIPASQRLLQIQALYLSNWMMILPENLVNSRKQVKPRMGYQWCRRFVESRSRSRPVTSQSTTMAFTIQNPVCSANHQRESLENRVISWDLADAHEEVLDSLDVDAHDLWNEISDLLLLLCS